MWKMILGQSIYKLALCFTLYFAGNGLLNLNAQDETEQLELDTIIFNTFVWMQIFNELNCRRLDNRLNIFEGLHRNYWFLAINFLMVGGQVLIIFVGGAAFHVTRLNGAHWAVCIICGLICIPWAAALKFVPDRYVNGLISVCTKATIALVLPIKRVYDAARRCRKTRSRSGAYPGNIA